jgi:hypothetical protein
MVDVTLPPIIGAVIGYTAAEDLSGDSGGNGRHDAIAGEFLYE